MVLGGVAAVVVASVLSDVGAELAGDVRDGILVHLPWSREASFSGKEPNEDGEAEARGSFSLGGNQVMLVGTKRPRLLQPSRCRRA